MVKRLAIALVKRRMAKLTTMMLLALLCLHTVSAPALARSSDEDSAPCELRDEIRLLSESVRELVDLLRTQSQRAEAEGLVNQIVALDQAIVNLDSSLRGVLRERDEVAAELFALRREYDASVKKVDDPTYDESIRANLRKFVSVQLEKISQRDERLAHLDARANELRDTIRERQVQRGQLEKAFGAGG